MSTVLVFFCDEKQILIDYNHYLPISVYRDARSLNRFQIAKITKSGATISEPKSVATSWGFAEGLRGYGPQTQ